MAANAVGEVVVTARKRQEPTLNVPVVESVLPQSQLERFQTNNLNDVAKLVPGISIADTLLSIGTQVSLRGVGTSVDAVGVEQSISLNLDGLQMTQGLSYQIGIFDVGQIEVLKGPQSLFYGQSSPGGVISIRTADPTNQREVIARTGYEFEAREKRGELIISGPVTDTLKLRLATMYDQSDGYFKNPAVVAPGTGGLDPTTRRLPDAKDYIVRGTAVWNPTSKFDARLKLAYTHHWSLYAGTPQLVSCPDGVGAPLGIPFIAPDETCKLDRIERVVDYNPAFFPGVENDGRLYLEISQKIGTLELNYHLAPDLTLSSTTGYYDIHSSSLISTGEPTYAAPPFSFSNHWRRRETTEELRLNSDFASPLNFTLGGFYQDGRFSNEIILLGNAAYGFPPVLQRGTHNVSIGSYSVFGQARWTILPKLELAGGARWTSEKRTDKPIDLVAAPTPVPLAVPRIKANNVSPELTLTYRPTDTLTLFGALKRGYKSGSFTTTVPAVPGDNNAFGDEEVEGGEVGLKSRLLNHRLAFDIGLYDYRYTGLQVGANEPPKPGELPIERTLNAGSARVYGIEFNSVYRPPQVDGLTLNLAANWNRARFKELNNVPCWGGQTIAEGCNQELDPNTGLFIGQNLAGLPLVRAPDWSVNFGFEYERPIGHDLTVIFSSNNQYSSKYPTTLSFRPDTWQKAYIKADLSLTLRGREDRWELALIGKNIGNVLTTGHCVTLNVAGGLLGGEITGGTGRGPAGVDEVVCFTERGRGVWLRLTLRAPA